MAMAEGSRFFAFRKLQEAAEKVFCAAEAPLSGKTVC